MAGDKGGAAKEGMEVNLIKTYMRMKFSNFFKLKIGMFLNVWEF